MSYCSYKNCENRTHPLHSKAFFTLPTDTRREIWIRNSGNPDLLNISESTTKKFCEIHFIQKYLKRQFNRTLLTRDAIPIPYDDEEQEEEEEQEYEHVEILDQSEDEKIKVQYYSPVKSPPKKKSRNESCNTEYEIRDDVKEIDENYETIYEDDLHQENINQKNENNILHEENAVLTNRVYELEKRTDTILGRCTMNVESHINIDPVEKITKSTQTDFEEKIVEPPKIITETVFKQPEYTEDEHFALSLAGKIQRFGPEKRAKAKLMMMKYLMEVETGITMNF